MVPPAAQVCLQFAQVAKEASALLALRPTLVHAVAAHHTMASFLAEGPGGASPRPLPSLPSPPPSECGGGGPGGTGPPPLGAVPDTVQPLLAACTLEGSDTTPLPSVADLQAAADRMRQRVLGILQPELQRLQRAALSSAHAVAARHGVPVLQDPEGPQVDSIPPAVPTASDAHGAEARRRAYPGVLAACRPFFELYRLAQVLLGDGSGPGLMVTGKWV